ncbi:hypothetical protein Taro_034208 [Colocasia esculenta]|uniref:Uncharacterized protein n=1 Tax=Colocasia esculenta TaxID=4460 RepID=A0A843VQN9_COLES|nr:hypothetical protein [Colocasia esculenta]
MKRNYMAFAEEIPPYSGPKAARETHADLKQLSAIPGHIYTRLELQVTMKCKRKSKSRMGMRQSEERSKHEFIYS